MAEGLAEIETIIAQMKVGPDPDQQFLADLEQVILAKVKQGGSMVGATPQQAGAGPGQGGPPGGPGGGPGGPPAGPGGPQGAPGGPGGPNPGGVNPQQAAAMGQAGVMPRPNAGGQMDADEMRRLLLTRAGS